MAVPGAESSVVGGGTFLQRHALRLLNLLVLAVIVVLLSRQINGADLRHAIGNAALAPLAGAFCLNAPIMALFVVRSHIVLVRLGHRVERRVLVPAIILGNVAGSLTPASSGELLRATALRGHAQVPATDSAALVFFERGMSVYLMALGTAVAAAFVALPGGFALLVLVAALALTAAPAFGSSLLRALRERDAEERSSFLARSLGGLRRASDRLGWILDHRGVFAVWSLVTACILMLSALQVWLLARSVADIVDVKEAWVAFGGSQLAGIVSLLPLGIGALDGSLAAILRKYGMSFGQGTAAAVLLRAVITIPYGIVAIACYAYLHRLENRRRHDAAI